MVWLLQTMKNYTPTAYPSSVAIVTEYRLSCHAVVCQLSRYTVAVATHQQGASFGTADIFRGIMVSLYVKGKENGHVQAYAHTGAMVLK